MKFQNCIINFVKDARTDKPEAICPFNFSKVGGIKILDVLTVICYVMLLTSSRNFYWNIRAALETAVQ